MKTQKAPNTSIPSDAVALTLLPSTIGILTEAAIVKGKSVKEVAEDFLNSPALCDWQAEDFPIA